MAVANFHYTTGISSGFKVYILEGQPRLKADPRLRLLPRPPIPIYPIKRKLSPDPRRGSQAPEEPPPGKLRRAQPGTPPPPRYISPRSFPINDPFFSRSLQVSSERPGREGERRASGADPPSVSPRPLPDQGLELSKAAGPPGALPASVLQQMRPSVITRLPSLPRPSPAPARRREFPVLLESPLAWGLDQEVPLLCLESR
ncbi:serine/arginine repetitive matrix protein 1-like [Ornithorhynchus anatinus]|uniref:serine/arginine repetitive matrix protein 1-like n=1 Tax=Ornithorhynchus anatinus TaxID=9258 RepID=UPI0019D4CF5A|nr:serine/arginine repetitive matrix protein 1-like [Ornithorhynchus anatinus]